MAQDMPIELESPDQAGGLIKRLLAGEIFVLRRALQSLDLYDTIVEASLSGVRNSAGSEVSEKVAQSDFDRIHEWVSPTDIPAVTDSVYDVVQPLASGLLKAMVPRLFPEGGTYYFEPYPNIRFQVPYDFEAKARRVYEEFARRHGLGKISAHGPHRDSWVDCPDNGINLWIAIGPVRRGNGLSIYYDDYLNDLTFGDSYIEGGQRLHPPLNFDLNSGDMILFHGDHVHASELNRTDATRVVISFRMTFGKPHFPNGHYHEYVHAGMMGGPFRDLAALPAKMQPSFVAYRGRWLRKKVLSLLKKERPASSRRSAGAAKPSVREETSIPLSELAVGDIRPVSKSICVVRLAEDRFVAVSRRCPHMGADLADGWVEAGQIVCPWHNLHIDPDTGASPCSSLRPLRRFALRVDDERVYVRPEGAGEPQRG